ncbi:MAG: hypothetical protein SFU86_18850 [Pirellulaceae bacterium]|nr:hypothetical protein [Pirellulaceae bacterium]
MLSIALDPTHQQRLDALAHAHGQDGPTFARQVLLDYLDFQSLPGDTDAAWAEAAVALTPEIMPTENWDEPGHGS